MWCIQFFEYLTKAYKLVSFAYSVVVLGVDMVYAIAIEWVSLIFPKCVNLCRKQVVFPKYI